MGYKSVLRGIGAMARQAERNSIRRHNELVRQQKQYAKMAELERASYEVAEYENRIEQLVTIHQDCSPEIDWKNLSTQLPPNKPTKSSYSESKAREALISYRPTFFDKLFKKVESKKQRLENAIKAATREDERIFEGNLKHYEDKLREHNESVGLAQKVLSGDVESYIEVIRELAPFSELSDLGSSIVFRVLSGSRAEVDLNVKPDNAIPKQVKTLLKSGKLSVREMPVGKLNELYQDYVCSAVLRIGREMFALLPLTEVIVSARAKMVDTSTGKLTDKTILSVLIPKESLYSLDYNNIDPSDTMRNFKYNMGFKRSIGLGEVDAIDWL